MSGGGMRRVAAVAGVAVALASACGQTPFERGAGSHCESGPPEHNQSLSDLVRLPRWAEVASVSEREGSASPPLHPARLSVARPMRGEWGASVDVVLDEGAVEEARAERSGKARLLAMGDGGPNVGLLSLRPDGEVHFLGACADAMFRPDVERLRAARAAAGDARSEADLVLEAVRDPGGPAARTLAAFAQPRGATPTPGWAQRPADDRVLDGEAPPEVLAALDERALVFHLPAGWQGAEVQLCPRVPDVGWGVCTVPQAAKAEIVLNAYAKPGKPIEVWVADRVRGFRGERRLALSIPPAVWSPEPRIAVYGSPEVRTRDDALRLAPRGALYLR